MKKLVGLSFIIFFALIISSCKKDDSSNPSGPTIGGPGTNVAFTVSTVQGQQGVNFNFKPSTSVTLTQITVKLPAQNFQDPVQGDGTTVYDTQTGFSVGEYTGVQSGQQWSFNIQGKIGTAQGQTYNKDVNFTIP